EARGGALSGRRLQHLLALGWKLGSRPHTRFVIAMLLGALGLVLLVEPPRELLTAVSRRERGLGLAEGARFRAGEAHVKMIVVSPPGPDFLQPGTIPLCLLAERLLDERVDEDAIHSCVLDDDRQHANYFLREAARHRARREIDDR